MKAGVKIGFLLVMVSCLCLAGCDFFASLFDPLVGTWSYSDEKGVGYTFVLKGDKTFTITATDGSTTFTASGTYSEDTTSKIITLNVTASDFTSGGPSVGSWPFSYTLSSDNKTLTISSSTLSANITLTKQ